MTSLSNSELCEVLKEYSDFCLSIFMATGSAKASGSRRGGSTLQKIAQKKEQLKLFPRVKKIERIATHLGCQVCVN